MPQSPQNSQFLASPPGHLTPASWALQQRKGFDPYAVALSAGSTLFDGVTLIVRVAFSTNPGSPPGWDDITPYVRSLSTRRGRTSELDTYQAGTVSLVLDNRDRRFDPTYVSSPYYPNVLPMRRINIQAVYAGITYDIFTGYVDGWPQAYEIPNEATVTVNATDAFKFLANVRVPESVFAVEVKADAPSAWYRLGEQNGTTMVDSSGNGRHGTYTGGATFNSRAGLIKNSANTAIGFDGVDDSGIVDIGNNPITGFPFSIEVWTQSLTGMGVIFSQSAGFWRVALMHGPTLGQIEAFASGSSASIQFTSTANTYWSPTPFTYHIVATFSDGSTAPIIYANGGAAAGTPAASNTVVWNPSAATRVGGDITGVGAFFTGVLDEIIVYPTVLSPTRVGTHYLAGTAPWIGDDTGTRITRILDQIGWPAADRNIAVGKATLGNASLNGEPALTILKQSEQSEQGYFFVAADGKITFQNRHQRITATASVVSQATFGDTGSQLPYMDVTLPYGDTSITNRIKGSRVDSTTTLEVSDAASIAANFERSAEFNDLYVSSDLELLDLLNWRLVHYKDPLLRIDALTVNPRTSPATMFPHVLGRTFGDRVTLVRSPQGIGTPITKDVHIEGINHTITPDSWVTSYYLSPADTQTYFILDDATFGQLDFNRLGF